MIKASLLNMFLTYYRDKESCPVISQRNGITCRLRDLGNEFQSIIEFDCPDIDANRWKYLFQHFTEEDPKIVKEMSLATTLRYEDEGCAEQFETSIRALRFAFLTERASLNTQYSFYDYDGKIG